MKRGWKGFVSAVCVVVGTVGATPMSAREIHVAKTGSDASSGNQPGPYLTIGKAAEVAQPGDTVTIHAGTYREWVKPARGGTSEQQSHYVSRGGGRTSRHQRV